MLVELARTCSSSNKGKCARKLEAGSERREQTQPLCAAFPTPAAPRAGHKRQTYVEIKTRGQVDEVFDGRSVRDDRHLMGSTLIA